MRRFCPELETALCSTDTDCDRIFYEMAGTGRAGAFFYGIADMPAQFDAWHELTEDAWVIRADIKTTAGLCPAGFMIFQPGAGQARFCHFCVYPGFDDIVVPMGLDIEQWAFSNSNLSCLVGLTPKPFRHVTNFFRRAGFAPMGTVPGACYIARRGRYCDGVVSVCTRESLAAAMQQRQEV